MARKKSNDEQGVSMDSLMDALTNVVAVLIVILILLQVDVGQTVERMLNDLVGFVAHPWNTHHLL